MSRFSIIPCRERMDETLALCEEYNLGLELNDFMFPKTLDDEEKCKEIVGFYKEKNAPITTSHGDFFDVLVFSEDPRIVEISEKRIHQSIKVSRRTGAKGVIFHSNIEPFLTADAYRNNWCERNEYVFRIICTEYPDMNVYMENMFDMRPDELAKLADRMLDVPNFGICFDYSHAYLTSTPLSTWAQVLSPYIKHAHINDNDGIGDLHLAVGDGTIDWEKFALLREKYFKDASVLIETSSIEYQKKSLSYLEMMGVLKK